MKLRFTIRDLLALTLMLAGFVWIGRTQVIQWHDRLYGEDSFRWQYAAGATVVVFGGAMWMAGQNRAGPSS